MNKLSTKISDWLLSKNHITLSQKSDIIFSLEVVLSNALSFLSIIVLGILLDYWNYTIVYLIIFIVFRSLRDRYHARTFLGCYILTVGLFLICISLVHLIPDEFQQSLTIILTIVNSCFLIFQEKSSINSNKLLGADGFVKSFLFLNLLIGLWSFVAFHSMLLLVVLTLLIIALTANKST
jgi:hypothetical protein